jgi:hypothetical protein
LVLPASSHGDHDFGRRDTLASLRLFFGLGSTRNFASTCSNVRMLLLQFMWIEVRGKRACWGIQNRILLPIKKQS